LQRITSGSGKINLCAPPYRRLLADLLSPQSGADSLLLFLNIWPVFCKMRPGRTLHSRLLKVHPFYFVGDAAN
jgi:hypothetical protein